MKTTTALLAPVLLLSSCATTANEPARYPQEGPAKLGQTVYVDGPLVRPDKVIEDSRCPVDVQCVWAGRVVLLATVTTGQGPKQMEIISNVPVSVADGMLWLVKVEPAKDTRRADSPADYRFTFKFDGGL